MLQRINRSLAPQCLATPESEEQLTQANGEERSSLEAAPSAAATKPGKQMGTKQRNNRKAFQRAHRAPGEAQPHPNGRNQSPPTAFHQGSTHPLHTDQRSYFPMCSDSLMGPVPQPNMPVNFSRPLYTGPFNYPPPPLNHHFVPILPPVGPMPFPPQAWHQGHPPPRPRFFPRNASLPQPRTSSPIPGPRRALHYEEDYARWIKRLEEGGRDRRSSAPIESPMENRIRVNDNVYQHQMPLGVPFCLPPRCEPMMVPVGFLPNGCFGPIPPAVFQCPAPIYPGNVFPSPMQGPVGVPMLLNRPFSETDV